LLEADVLFNGMERLFTTLLGVAFALGIIALLEYLARRSSWEPAAGLRVVESANREISRKYDQTAYAWS